MAGPARGAKVGEYILEEEVGRGTFGQVWRARHAVLGTVAAVKIPTDPDYIRNLRTEGMIQHQIDSPHVVKTLGIDPWHDPPYLTVEYVQGQSLRSFLGDERPLPVETAIQYARQILVALQAAHEIGVIHRDLKPENILVTDDGLVKVTDFGLGRIEEATTSSLLMSGSLQTAGGDNIAGTVEYMAPEQKRPGGAPDQRVDLYAFGVILFEMLTGIRPTGTDVPSELNPKVPTHWDDIYRRCHCHVSRRLPTAVAVLSAFQTPAVPTVEPVSQPRPSLARVQTAVPPGPEKPARRAEAIHQLPSDGPLTSKAIIAYLADVEGLTHEQAAAVIDAFWDCLTDRSAYQGTGKRGSYLVIPHFGTFRLTGGGLTFASRKIDVLRGALNPPKAADGGRSSWSRGRRETRLSLQSAASGFRHHSTQWATRAQSMGSGRELSVKRRIAHAIARAVEIDDALAGDALWELLDLLTAIFIFDHRDVVWARRGVMYFSASRQRYQFRCYPSFRQWVADR